MDWELWCMRGEPFSFSLEQYCCGEMETTEGFFAVVWVCVCRTEMTTAWDFTERGDSSPNDTPAQAEGNLFKSQPNITWLSFYMYLLGILLPPEKQFSSEKRML